MVLQYFDKLMNCQCFDKIWNSLAPLDPLFDKMEILAPPGVEFDIIGRMFILSVVGFLLIRAFAENVPLPLPKYKTWNKLTVTHFIWAQIWHVWILCTAWQLYNATSNSTYANSGSNRFNRAVPGASVFCHGHLAMTLANLFIVRWLNIQKPFVTAQGMVPMRLVMWTVGCQFAQYWAARTGGLVFVSTWFLVNAQAFAAFPALKLKYPKLNTLNRLAFALSFLIIRVGLWACWMKTVAGDVLMEFKSSGLSYPLVLLTIGWTLLTLGHIKSGVKVWNGLVDYLRGKAKVPVVWQLRTKVA